MHLILPPMIPRRFLAFAAVMIMSLTILFRLDAYGILPEPPQTFSPIITSLGSQLALQGYDPVAYFTQGQPVVGQARYELLWQGFRWHFSESRHRDMFAANPQAYVPAVGGYDFSALRRGWLARGDPRYGLIRQGRLLLFASDYSLRRSREGNYYRSLAPLYWLDLALGDVSQKRAFEHRRVAK